MALQLTGAYKRSSLANLQVRLPGVVIGGGLTAIDTATEMLAYYVVQAEKTLERFETLGKQCSARRAVRASFDAEETEILDEFVTHGRAIRAERVRAREENREPRFQKLLDSWGGVRLVYRKKITDSPAYRLNHEEVEKFLEEGVRFVEGMSPVVAIPDARAARSRAMTFKNPAGNLVELGARHGVRGGGGHVAEHDLREGAPGHVRAEQARLLRAAQGDARGRRRGHADAGSERLLHVVQLRGAHGQLLR